MFEHLDNEYMFVSRLELELQRDKQERDERERELRERQLRELEFREKMKQELEMKPPGWSFVFFKLLNLLQLQFAQVKNYHNLVNIYVTFLKLKVLIDEAMKIG